MNTSRPHRFGEQRLHREDVALAHRVMFRLMGVGEPAHYLHHLYLRQALDSLPARFSPSTILDAGCGSGDHTFYLARRFPKAEVVGIDVDERIIAREQNMALALGLQNVKFLVGSVEKAIPGVYDLIVSIDVLEHLHEQARALRLLRGALSDRGAAFFHIPTIRPRPVPLSRWIPDFHDWAAEEHVADDLTAEQFETATRAAGFNTVRSWRTFGYWTGELATSLFAIPFKNTPRNRLAQAALAPLCRGLVMLDPYFTRGTRYAVALLLKP